MKAINKGIKTEKKEFDKIEKKLKLEIKKQDKEEAEVQLARLKEIYSRLSKIDDKKNLKEIDKKIKDYDKEISQISMFRKNKSNKKQKEKVSKTGRRRRLKAFISKADIDVDPNYLIALFFKIGLIVTFVLAIGFLVYGSLIEPLPVFYLLLISLAIWLLGFPLLYVIGWALFFMYIDLKIYQRKSQMEEVLADFLQLTSANIRAGMPIDRALWYAVRPKFGVLANEIEMVAKETMSGKDLKEALRLLAKKYESEILNRTVSLLTEGLNAGGEIGDLLNKIAIDIQETRTMQKEMAANIMTYVIFIGFASIVAAPLLFGLSKQLIVVVSSISSSFSDVQIPSSIGIGFGSGGINAKDFQTFAMVSLTITSIFTGMIIAMIQKGNVRDGLKYIPLFIAATLGLFFIFDYIFGLMMGMFF